MESTTEEKLDLTKYDEPEAVAKAIRDHLRKLFCVSEDNYERHSGDMLESEIFVSSPDETNGWNADDWEVCFESGPLEWGIKLSLQEEYFGITGHMDHDSIWLEAGYSFSVIIREN